MSCARVLIAGWLAGLLILPLSAAVGPDPMTGQPFEYVRTGQGFLLAADRNGANEGFAFLTEK